MVPSPFSPAAQHPELRDAHRQHAGDLLVRRLTPQSGGQVCRQRGDGLGPRAASTPLEPSVCSAAISDCLQSQSSKARRVGRTRSSTRSGKWRLAVISSPSLEYFNAAATGKGARWSGHQVRICIGSHVLARVAMTVHPLPSFLRRRRRSPSRSIDFSLNPHGETRIETHRPFDRIDLEGCEIPRSGADNAQWGAGGKREVCWARARHQALMTPQRSVDLIGFSLGGRLGQVWERI